MSEPRYGIWAPVGGNFGPLNTPDEPIDASYERTRSLVLEAERLGCLTTANTSSGQNYSSFWAAVCKLR